MTARRAATTGAQLASTHSSSRSAGVAAARIARELGWAHHGETNAAAAVCARRASHESRQVRVGDVRVALAFRSKCHSHAHALPPTSQPLALTSAQT